MNKKIEKLFEIIFNKFADKLIGPTIELKEITFESFESNEFPKFFEKLEHNKETLFIVKDPYKLAFAPYYLFWFWSAEEETTYRIFISPDSYVYGKLKSHIEISFPTGTNYPWMKKISWSEIKNESYITR